MVPARDHPGMEIRAHLELSGDDLHVHANSEARFERVLAAVAKHDPSAPVLRETRKPAGDLKTAQTQTGGAAQTSGPGDESGNRRSMRTTRPGGLISSGCWTRSGRTTANPAR